MTEPDANRRLTLKQAADFLVSIGFEITEEGLRSRVRRKTVPFHRLPPQRTGYIVEDGKREGNAAIWFYSAELEKWRDGEPDGRRPDPKENT